MRPHLARQKRHSNLWLTLSTWFIFSIIPVVASAQVTVTATAGADLGPHVYTTLGAAFAAVNAGTHQGVIAISITGNTTETASALLNASSGTSNYSQITIRPLDNTSIRTIVSSFTTATPLVNLSGASNVTIDGSVSGSGQYLRFRNSGPTAANQAAAIQFDAGANNDALLNCIVEGSGTSTLRGTVSLGTSGTTNHITISGNDLRDMTATRIGSPQNLIWGGNAGASSITISNNTFHNFLLSGINLGGWPNAGTATVGSNVTISGNSIYNDHTGLTYAGGFCAIGIGGSGDGHLVSGNYLGGSAPLCAGAAWAYSFQSNFNNVWAISVSAPGTTTGTSIQGNTIQNIAFGGVVQSFMAINAQNGKFAIGTVTGNTIGHPTTANSITFTRGNVSSPGVFPIQVSTGSSADIRNNVIANLSGSSSVSVDPFIRGIALNTNSSSTGTWTVENNTLQNLSFPGHSDNGAYCLGIAVTTIGTAPAATYDIGGIAGNTLSGLAFGTSTGSNYGIYLITTGSATQVVSNNQISGITAVLPLYGISVSAPNGTLQRNRIWNLTNPTAAAVIGGVDQVGGNWTLANNEISLKNDSNTNSLPVLGIAQDASASGSGNLYFNSVYIGGSQSSGGAANSYAFRRQASYVDVLTDNLLFNERTGNGSHYAVGSTVSGSWTSNNNALISGNGAQLGQWVGADETFGAWQAASGGDAASTGETAANVPSAQLFTDATNGVLDIKPTTAYDVPPLVSNAGTPVSVLTDFNNVGRDASHPDIGATEIAVDRTLAAPGNLPPASPNYAGNYDNVTVSGGGAPTLTGDANVFGVLSLGGGNVTTGSHVMTMRPGGSVSRTSGSVDGNLRKYVPTGSGVGPTFEIGTGPDYAPVDVQFGTVSTAGYLQATTVGTEHPNVATSGLNPSKSVNRYWTITNLGTGFTTANPTFHFVPGDLDPGANPSAFLVKKYDAPNWSSPATGLQTPTSTQAAGVTSFSDFAVGDPPSHTLTYLAGAHGSITGTTPQEVTEGQNGAPVTAVPDAGYHFVSWSDGLGTAARTDTNVLLDLTVTASFAINTYTLTYTAGANGSISGTSPQTVNYAASGSAVTAVGNFGYQFVSWSDGVLTASRTESNVMANLSVTASFAPSGNSVNVGPASGLITLGNPVRTVPVTINRTSSTPMLGFSVFFSVSSPLAVYHGTSGIHQGTYLSDANPTTSFNLIDDGVDGSGNHNYEADGTTLGAPCGSSAVSGTLFTIDLSSAAASGSGTVTITNVKLRDCGNADLPWVIGTSATLSVDQSAPTVQVTAPNGGETWHVGSPQNITWTGSDPEGITSFDLAYSTDGGSSYPNAIASAVPGTQTSYAWTVPATPGTAVRVRVTAHDANSNSAADASDANFTIAYYTLAYTAGAGGSITGTASQSVGYGASGTTVTATPNLGYHFVNWSDGYPTATRTDVNVTANVNATASFAIDTFTLTYAAGAGGTIVGASPQTVNYGASGTLVTATPNTGYHFVSWSDSYPTAARTDVNVTANVNATATFAIDTFTLTYTAGAGGTIVGASPQTVNYGASGTAVTATPNTGYHFVSWSDSYPTAARTDLNVTTDVNATATFAIDTFTLTYAAGAGGTIVGASPQTVNYGASGTLVTATPNTGYHFVSWSDSYPTAARTDLNVTANVNATASFAANPPVAAVANLHATQVRPGTAGAQTTPITLTWDATPVGTTVELWRKGFGSYPEYDDAGGAIPTASASYPPGTGWVKVDGLTTPGGTDLTPTRDFYYYVAYAQDVYGTWSPASTLTTGTLNYLLGDVSNGFVAGTGNNSVYSEDISLLGAYYGLANDAMTAVNYLDVGPTTTMFVDGRPTTDNRIDFEDLVMFSIDFGLGHTGSTPAAVSPVASTITADELILEAPDHANPGQTFTARLTMRGTGALIALSTNLSWDPAVVEPVSHTIGDWLAQQAGQAFSAKPGNVDAAVMRAQGMTGEGVLATVTFRVLSAGDPKLGIAALDGRDSHNRKVGVKQSLRAQAPVVPLVTQLAFARPNPFRQKVNIPFSLSAGGAVNLVIYSVDGRRVRTLVNETREPGEYTVAWDGRDENGSLAMAGVYYVRLITPQGRFTRTVTNLK